MRRSVGILLAACALTGWSACGAAGPLEWHDVKDLFLDGRPFPDAATYGRLPARFRGVIQNPKARHLADNSAGLCARFRTDANRITFRWTLLEKGLLGYCARCD